ncbi:MAG: ROK family transcriptional regulator [Bryobacteraceae bacterium]
MDRIHQREKILRPRQVRGANSAALLELLQRHERLSRAELARYTGLSEGTVSRIVTELIRRRLVMEDGEENSTGGRPATCLRLERNRFAFGADIHSWETQFGVCSLRGTVVETASVRTPRDPDAVLELIVEQFNTWRTRYGNSNVAGLGVSVRGIVNSRSGVVVLGADPGWVNIPVQEKLQSRLKTPVYVENNVRAAALAEYSYGNPGVRDSRCLLVVVVDEGVGIGIVLDGRIHHGPRMAAGEFGQMVIQATDSPDRYDRPGCLERLASNIALCERYAALSRNASFGGSGNVAARVRMICHNAMDGEPAARTAIAETCKYLGIGVSNAAWGLDADTVIIHGIINEAWPMVAPIILDQFPESGLTVSRQSLVLRPSLFGREASLVGVATLPFRRIFFEQGQPPQEQRMAKETA